jgi:hypothetical protein
MGEFKGIRAWILSILGNLRYLETALRKDLEELHYDDMKCE